MHLYASSNDMTVHIKPKLELPQKFIQS